MHIDNRDSTDRYTLTIDYQTKLFRQDGEISLIVDRILLIVRQMISDNTLKIKDLSILPESEYQHVIYDFNNTAVDYPKEKCVHELFSEQTKKTPDKIALVFEDKQFTYKQLDELSNSLANYLRNKGVKPNDIVPIIAKRDWRIIVAMLGILKAGGAYMSADPSYPVERIEYMLDTAKSKIALTYDYPDKLNIETVDLMDFDFSNSTTEIDNVNTPNDLCYIIFTSGSTGKPKGVMITHKNLVNFSNSNKYSKNQQCYMLKSCSSVLSMSALTFDISVYEIMFTLINGLKLVFANSDEISSSEMLSKLITKHNVDIIHSTPTKLIFFLNSKAMQNALQNIKVFMIGAENFSEETYKKIKMCSSQATVFNGYGPSETTIGCTFCLLDDKCDITIGKPIANTQVYILDQNHKPLPIGVAGELCISGDGVGAGYLNRPELTAEKYITNPFIDGKTMYCTGDLARWREDGEIEYLGRIDTQVKIRGLRIELGEIEGVISTFADVQLAAVTDKQDESGRQYLVGYYTSENVLDEKALRTHLAAKLPKYMIPNYFMRLDEMPMTASGKTDRKNLPVPEFSTAHTEFVSFETQTEIQIARIWSELLKVDKIGRDDDFFDLGGDSLLAITLLAQLEAEFNADLSMKGIMEHSALKAMAACLDNAKKCSVTITAHHKDKYILLPQQKTIYAVCSKNPVTLTYNMPAFVPLLESVDREKIKACFKQLINKHRMLKSYIKAENGDIYGIYDENAELEFEEYKCGDYSEFVRPFDLSKAPLMRVAFTTDGMLVDIHHIISDGEGLNIILRDLAALYKGETVEKSKIEYSDYAEYYLGTDFSVHKEYFKNMLKCDFEPITLPERRDKSSGGISAIYNIDKNIFDKHIAIIGENSYEWLVAFLAIVNGGNVAVPIDKEQSSEGIKQLLLQSDCKAVIVSKSYADLTENIDNITVFLMSDIPQYISAGKDAVNSGKTEFTDYLINADKLAAIFFTSGTTGRSKGVMLSHKNMASDINFACRNFRLDGNTLAVLPFHHTFGLITAIFKVFNYGKSTFINNSLKHIQKDLLLVRPQTVFMVPLFVETFYKTICDTAKNNGKDKTLIRAAKISNILLKIGIDIRKKLFRSVLSAFGGNLEYIICGGAALDAKYVKAFRSWGINILNGYGITECSPVVSVNRNHYWRDGSVGQVLEGCTVKISEDGEVLVKGGNIMLGYYKEDIATEEALIDGWYFTGDLGYIDKDGFLFLTGRKKDLITLSNGENISPEEIEKQILQNDAVAEVVIYSENGFLTAEIFPDEDYIGNQQYFESLIFHLNQKQPRYRQIHKVKLRDQPFAKNSTKKILRYKVLEDKHD